MTLTLEQTIEELRDIDDYAADESNSNESVGAVVRRTPVAAILAAMQTAQATIAEQVEENVRLRTEIDQKNTTIARLSNEKAAVNVANKTIERLQVDITTQAEQIKRLIHDMATWEANCDAQQATIAELETKNCRLGDVANKQAEQIERLTAVVDCSVELLGACEEEFDPQGICLDEDDAESVMAGTEGGSPITFGMLRNLKAALAHASTKGTDHV